MEELLTRPPEQLPSNNITAAGAVDREFVYILVAGGWPGPAGRRPGGGLGAAGDGREATGAGVPEAVGDLPESEKYRFA